MSVNTCRYSTVHIPSKQSLSENKPYQPCLIKMGNDTLVHSLCRPFLAGSTLNHTASSPGAWRSCTRMMSSEQAREAQQKGWTSVSDATQTHVHSDTNYAHTPKAGHTPSNTVAGNCCEQQCCQRLDLLSIHEQPLPATHN